MVVHLDCTLRDGGYYNAWDFSQALIYEYLKAVRLSGVDAVELGFRTLAHQGFKGACAYTTDKFINSLGVPAELTVGVMVNASEIVKSNLPLDDVLRRLFPEPGSVSPVKLVRVACHVHEFFEALPASAWLKENGFDVGFNLMQVADRTEQEIVELADSASKWPIDVLYFADSMGSMTPNDVAEIITWLRRHWKGNIGIHAHNNMGMALQNTLRAIVEGATWVDSTVTGMGRGPGNTPTEYLALEIAEQRDTGCNIVPLMSVIRQYFHGLKQHYGWGMNTYYYLAGKYGVHPTFIQEMLADSRYNEEDVLAVIEHLRLKGGKKYSADTLDAARHFYKGDPRGSWNPADALKGREVLLLGAGPGVARHRVALESYIREKKPYVVALNTQSEIDAALIDVRVACHPVRLLADIEAHASLPQPLVAPVSMLPDDVRQVLKGHEVLDFGISVRPGIFEFHSSTCVVPCPLVVAYALAIAASGRACHVSLAGFDGYEPGDQRNAEMEELLSQFEAAPNSVPVSAITPTVFNVSKTSVYAI